MPDSIRRQAEMAARRAQVTCCWNRGSLCRSDLQCRGHRDEYSFRSAKVVIEGDGDFRGTLECPRKSRRVTDIRMRFEVDSDASDEQLAMLLKQTERFCVIYQTLRSPPRMAATLQRLKT